MQGGSDTDARDTEGEQEQEEQEDKGGSRASTSVTILPKVIQKYSANRFCPLVVYTLLL